MVANPVIIEEYSSKWPLIFHNLSKIYSIALKDLIIGIEHVGSTAIPELAAKPIIDIDIIIENRGSFPDVVEKLEKLGYSHEGEMGIKGREAFKAQSKFVPFTKPKREWMAHNLYVCEKNNPELRRHLLFRDFLRHNPDKCVTYSKLKRNLAMRYRNNRENYTNAKTDFVETILQLASIEQKK